MQMAMRHVELKGTNYAIRRILKSTIGIYRSACAYIAEVILENRDDIFSCATQLERVNHVEALIHHTKKNPSPCYKDFDRLFYKFPSYYRRGAISFCLGEISSYFTRLSQWEEELHQANINGKKFKKKPPTLNIQADCCPSLYKKECYVKGNGNEVYIKVYVRNTWDWIRLGTDKRDWKSFGKVLGTVSKVCCPYLQYKHGKFYLAFPLKFKSWGFKELPVDQQLILAVDRGINHGAVCSIIDWQGNVYGRFFDPFERERKNIDRMLALIKDRQRKSGKGQSLASVYEKLDGIKKDYAKQLARWLVDIAVKHHVYGMVFEHLGKMKGCGALKERLHHWTTKTFMDLAKAMGLRVGIRTFVINPRNTSAFAYDGSGSVLRDADNYSMCTFASGKRYHADLSASYNIGARYFLRTMERELTSSDTTSELWNQLVAEVPELGKRTDCTLSTIWRVKTALDA